MIFSLTKWRKCFTIGREPWGGMPVNTLHLKYAVEVERTGSITQAAENLYMAQPNLSKAIRELEEQLGFAIFERTSKGVVPTPRGRQALKSAHRVLEELEKMRLLSRCAQARRRFSAVIPRDGYIAEGFARFAAAQDSREDIDLKVKEANAMEAIACVAEGSFALGVIRYPVRSQRYFLDFLQEKGLSHDAVWEFEPLLLMNARHPLAARETIYCADLRPYIQIVQGVEMEQQVDVIEEILKDDEEDDESKMVERPPVVCVMGHVDHGKTSLLDKIRSTHVTTGEAGGITQHIGAYTVETSNGKITFLDTPGHEAFTSMRMRGAQSTDIAILVVAADDGVMPQTIEAINHAKAAEVEIIVAVNKIDKESANIERVKQEMTEYQLIPEDWGGSTIFCPVSAHTGEGIPELLDMVSLTAEVLELKANPDRKARGIVLEAQLDKGRGPVATVLVQKGTLHVGDAIAVGNAHGKVRAMINDKGKRIKAAGPSTPVEILGLSEVPYAGEVCMAMDSEKEARSVADKFIAYGREKMLSETKSQLSLDDLFDQIQAGSVKELNIIVKADVQGSVEAVKQSLEKLTNDEVAVKVIHGGVGAINESDVMLASASNAIIIGFNVRPEPAAKDAAAADKVDMRLYRVIYNAIEDIESAMKGMLDPEFVEKVTGHADVRQIFKASGVGTIAGSYVTDGTIQRDSSTRIIRDGIVIHEGKLASVQRGKDAVKEVRSGFECGLVIENFNDIKEGDQIESFVMEEVPR